MKRVKRSSTSTPQRRMFVPLLWLSVGVIIGVSVRPTRNAEQVETSAESPATAKQRRAATSEATVRIVQRLAPPLDRLRQLLTDPRAVDFTEVALIIRELEAVDCRDAADLLRKIPGDERRALLNAFAAHWAEIDAFGAFSAAESERKDNDWRNRLGIPAGVALVALDPQAALRRITSARNNDVRTKTAEWVLPALAKTDPHLAASYLSTNKLLHRQQHLFRNVATEYAKLRPHDAIAWAERAVELATAQDKKGFRESLLATVWSSWAGTDPIACAAAIAGNPETEHHENVYASLAQAWSRKDVFAALEWARSLSDENSKSAALRSMDLKQVSPKEAREFILAINSEGLRTHYASHVAQELAEQDLRSAWDFVQTLPEGMPKEKALEPIINEWALSDPAAAAHRVAAMPESKGRADLLRRTLEVWTQEDPQSAITFIQTLSAGEGRDQALEAAINSIHEDHPQKALEWYRSMNDSDAKGSVAARLMGALIKSDRTTALTIAADIPPEAQPDAYKGLIRHWAFDQTKEAGEWINSLPTGKARDAAVEAYVSVIDGLDPALATTGAQSIQDPVNRMESTFKAFHRWIEKDRHAAVTWMEQTDIPEGLRPIFDRLLADKNFFD